MAQSDPSKASAASGCISRRQFLVRGALSAGAATLAARVGPALAGTPVGSAAALSRVVQARSDAVIGSRGIHGGVLLDLLHLALGRLTGKQPTEAWAEFLRPDDVVALKFNHTGADALATADPMLRALVQSLEQAGFAAEKLVAIEVAPAVCAVTGTAEPRAGWSAEQIDFGSGRDQLAAWLDQVTAIINVPFLKTHNLCGMTGCLKNLSHAVVKHPARYHAGGCSPFIADIVALPAVRGKLRLHLVNALRIVFEGGPEAREDCIWDAGMLLAGTDPVALDAIGLQTIDQVRAAVSLPPVAGNQGPPAYLEAAADRGLGTYRLHQVQLDKVTL